MSEQRVVTSRRRRRPTRAGVVLSDDLIIETALTLIEEHGPDALTVRRLGQSLGADPSAIYRYFRSTDDLLLALYDRLIGESLAGFDPPDDWVEALREFGRLVYRAHQRHPRLAALAAARITRRPNEFRAVDTGVGILRRAGFSAEDALGLYLTFIDTVLGLAALDASVAALSPEARAADAGAWTETYAHLPAADYPNLSEVRPHFAALPTSSFERALDLILTALSTRLPR